MSVIVKGGGGKSSGLYVWAKYNTDIGLGESINNIALANDGTSMDIYVKENLYIKEDGTIGVQGEPYSTVSISSVVEDTCIGGMTPTKYCIGVDGNVYSSPLSHIAGSVDNCLANLVKVVKSTFIDFVVSDSETAYPDGAVHTDGFYYEIFDKTGLYVWKKYSYVSSPTVTAQQTVADPSTFVLSSDDTDLTAYSFSDLIGLHIESDSSIKTYFEVIGDGTVKYYWNGSTYDFGSCTWDSSTKTLVVVGADYNGVNDNYTVSGLVGKKVLADYVVSDSPTAYPDGGIQGGYWYEKVVEGKAGIDFGEVTLASAATSVTVSHKLGVVPSWVAFFPKNLNVSTYGVGKAFANINGFALRIHDMVSGRIENDTANVDLTETTISFGSASSKSFEQTIYYWIAIA